MPVSEDEVFALVGQGMAEICDNHYTTESENHCAHFVSHALGIALATKCGDLAFATRGTGATVRCNELFNGLPDRGAWAARPDKKMPLLVFVTFSQNVRGGVMGMMPSKHVGIWFTQKVYNFSNTLHKVVWDPSPEAFLQKIGGSYKKAHPNNGEIGQYYAVPPV
jgi:hypothetical protein